MVPAKTGGAICGSQSDRDGVPAQKVSESSTADFILNNGKIITLDPRDTIAQAIAIAGGHIVAVGSDAAMAEWRGAKTRVIDLDQKTVIPGLIDGHAHMDREALRDVFPSLGEVRSIRDIQDRIAELASRTAP